MTVRRSTKRQKRSSNSRSSSKRSRLPAPRVRKNSLRSLGKLIDQILLLDPRWAAVIRDNLQTLLVRARREHGDQRSKGRPARPEE